MAAEIFTLDEMDRTFYEMVRLELVRVGLIPDLTLMADEEAYEAAKVTLRASLLLQDKMLVEIFGVGAAPDRDEKTYCKIITKRKSVNNGTLGGANCFWYEPYVDNNGNDKFRKVAYPEFTKMLRYEFRVVANNRAMEKTISEILYKILGQRKYVRTFNEYNTFGNKYFLAVYDGDVDLSNSNFAERMFSYVIPDVFVDERVVVNQNIVPLTSVNWCVNLVPAPKPFVEENVTDHICQEVVPDVNNDVYNSVYGGAYN